MSKHLARPKAKSGKAKNKKCKIVDGKRKCPRKSK